MCQLHEHEKKPTPPKWAINLAGRVAKAKADPRIPAGRWKAWGLFFITLLKIIRSIPAIVRGRKNMNALAKMNAAKRAETLDRILNPEKYRGK